MIFTINGQQAALKKGSSIEYVWINLAAPQQSYSKLYFARGLHKFSENRIFTDADYYSMEIEPPQLDCSQHLAIFGMITRKDVGAGDIFFNSVQKK